MNQKIKWFLVKYDEFSDQEVQVAKRVDNGNMKVILIGSESLLRGNIFKMRPEIWIIDKKGSDVERGFVSGNTIYGSQLNPCAGENMAHSRKWEDTVDD